MSRIDRALRNGIRGAKLADIVRLAKWMGLPTRKKPREALYAYRQRLLLSIMDAA